MKKLHRILVPSKESQLLVHISPLSCPVLQYGLEVLFGNSVVLLMCSASLELAPFIEHFSFKKLQEVGSGKWNGYCIIVICIWTKTASLI
jgi:hypothetical protein